MKKCILYLFAISGCLFSTDYEIITESSNPEVCAMILNGLEDFNLKFFKKKHGSIDLGTFVIYAKDGHSQIIGGLYGYIFESGVGSWASVDFAWVDESRRNQGIGTELFEKAEVLARMKNCTHMQLFTWAYQAVDFYKKIGFECVGIIPEWIENHDAVFFRKKLK